MCSTLSCLNARKKQGIDHVRVYSPIKRRMKLWFQEVWEPVPLLWLYSDFICGFHLLGPIICWGKSSQDRRKKEKKGLVSSSYYAPLEIPFQALLHMGSQNTDSRLHFSKEDFPAGHLDQGFAKKVGEAVWRQPDLLPLSLIPRLIFFLVQLEASGLFPFFTTF
jgi:hypothetical protein